MKSSLCKFAKLIVLVALTSAPAMAASPLTDGAYQLRDRSSNSGRLALGQKNALVEAHGQCRWLDNNSSEGSYFVPLATAREWQAFIDYAPPIITRAKCCPPTTIELTASDGQKSSFSLPIGRSGASDSLGVRDFSHGFTLTRVSDGATWIETVTERYLCDDGAWVGQGAVVTGDEPAEIADGLCGSASTTPSTIAPTTGLCSKGTPSAVSGSGPWLWSCSGTNGGQSTSCSASIIAGRQDHCKVRIAESGSTWSTGVVRDMKFSITDPGQFSFSADNGACSPAPTNNHPFHLLLIDDDTGEIIHRENSAGRTNHDVSGKLTYGRLWNGLRSGYRLGWDRTPCWTRTSASALTNLQPGKYRLKLIMENSCHDGLRCNFSIAAENIGPGLQTCGVDISGGGGNYVAGQNKEVTFDLRHPQTLSIDARNGACSPMPMYNHPFQVRLYNMDDGSLLYEGRNGGYTRGTGDSSCWTWSELPNAQISVDQGRYKLQFVPLQSCQDPVGRCTHSYRIRSH